MNPARGGCAALTTGVVLTVIGLSGNLPGMFAVAAFVLGMSTMATTLTVILMGAVETSCAPMRTPESTFRHLHVGSRP